MLLRRVARPMLAAIFIQGGIAALQSPQAHVQAAKPVLDAVTPVLEKATDAAAPTVDKAAESVPVDVPPRPPTGWTTSPSSRSTAASRSSPARCWHWARPRGWPRRPWPRR